ncbi:hypothetical protein TNCV_2439721 [Trichonephila clavipes]|nr:hypothetical protein TNCV_2439721 [Trichonephila clavipes]
MSLSSFRELKDATGQHSSPSAEKSDEHSPLSVCGRMSLSSFRVHQDATGLPSSASTEKAEYCLGGEKVTNTHRRLVVDGCRCHLSACTQTRPESRVVPRRKKVTNAHRRADAIACRCHLSACTKTRPDSRVVARRKKGTNTHRQAAWVGCRRHHSAYKKTRPDSGIGPRQKKIVEHPPPHVHGTMSLSSFRVNQVATGQQSSATTEKRVTNTHRQAVAVGCRCHRYACKKTRPYSRVVPRRKKRDEYPPPSDCGSMSLSSFRVHPDATRQQSSPSTEEN